MALYVYGFEKWRSYIYDKTIFHSRGEPGASSGGQQGDSWQSGRKIDIAKQLLTNITDSLKEVKNLEIALFEQVGTVFYNNPEMGRLMFELLFAYFDSYEVAKNEQVIWNGTQQAYNNNSFDCSEENKTLIKTFEEQLIAGLQQEQ